MFVDSEKMSSSDKTDTLDKEAQQYPLPIEVAETDDIGQGGVTYTKDEEKRVLNKIDRVILPMVCLLSNISQI